MVLYLAGAKDMRLEYGCLALCSEGDNPYRRLFSFFYRKDLDSFLGEFKNKLDFIGEETNENTDK